MGSLLLLLLVGCAGGGEGWLIAEGLGAPDEDAPVVGRRLSATEHALADARANLYERVCELYDLQGRPGADRMAVDPSAQARVNNLLLGARVVRQSYDPQAKTARVTVRCSAKQARQLLR